MKFFVLQLLLCLTFTLSAADQPELKDTLQSVTNRLEKSNPNNILQDLRPQSKYSMDLGLSFGYLFDVYQNFTPPFGFYETNSFLHELLVSTDLSLTYQNLFQLDYRLTFVNRFGKYHPYFVSYIHSFSGGVNVLKLINKDLSHRLYIKYNVGFTNNCTCGDDVPFNLSGMISHGFQIDYLKPISDTFTLHIGVGNNRIASDIEGKYNFTYWLAGFKLRLF